MPTKNLFYKYQKLFYPYYTEIEQMILRAITATAYFSKGDYLDFGSRHGGTLIPAYLFAKYNNIKNMKFFGFDSWEGCSEPGEKEKECFKKGDMSYPIEELQNELIKRKINDIKLFKGFFEETLRGKKPKDFGINNIRACYIDVVLYSPAKCTLDFITSALEDGAILMFDDYYLNRNHSGECRAVKEWLSKNKHIKLTPYHPYYWAGMSFIVNIKNQS